MKKKFLFLAILFFCVWATQSNAQPDPWELSIYNTKFVLPQGCKVMKDTGNVFEASKTSSFVGIYSFKDAGVIPDDLSEANLKIAKKLKRIFIKDDEVVYLNKYERYYIGSINSKA